MYLLTFTCTRDGNRTNLSWCRNPAMLSRLAKDLLPLPHASINLLSCQKAVLLQSGKEPRAPSTSDRKRCVAEPCTEPNAKQTVIVFFDRESSGLDPVLLEFSLAEKHGTGCACTRHPTWNAAAQTCHVGHGSLHACQCASGLLQGPTHLDARCCCDPGELEGQGSLQRSGKPSSPTQRQFSQIAGSSSWH